jgi:NAD(P)H dehydrogenase (quinone)
MAGIIVVYHSTYGHTKLQAEAVHRGVSGVEGVQAEIMTAAEATERLNDLDGADGIIFGTATYMGNISAGMKKFMEASVKKWFAAAWRDKVAGAFTNSSNFSGDKLNTLQGLFVFAMQHGMIWVGTGMFPSANMPDAMNSVDGPGPDAHNRAGSFIGPMAASFQVDPPAAPPKGDLETAEQYGRRVALATVRWIKGGEG